MLVVGADGTALREFEHALSGTVRAFVPNEATGRLAVLSEDGRSACVFDLATGRAVETLSRTYEVVRALVYAHGGAFAIGVVAGVAGDRWNLGFLAETERRIRHCARTG